MEKISICVVGLGYVGLPLAVAFGKKFETFGFDISEKRIIELKELNDKTLELTSDEISLSTQLNFTDDINTCSECNYFIVTVPTPIDQNKVPDLTFLKEASLMISKIIKKGDCIIYESTTFPGCTREFCVPLLEKGSNLKFNILVLMQFHQKILNNLNQIILIQVLHLLNHMILILYYNHIIDFICFK